MKRKATGVAACLSCLLIADLAFADRLPLTLSGPLERGGHAKIHISEGRRAGTPVEVYRWTFRRIVVRCEGERRVAQDPLEGGFAMNADFGGPGNWGIQGTGEGSPGALSYATRVRGRLVTWKRARGWIRVWGNSVDLRGGGEAECDSGRLRWVARR